MEAGDDARRAAARLTAEIPFALDGFVPALIGGIIVSVVTWSVSLLLSDAE